MRFADSEGIEYGFYNSGYNSKRVIKFIHESGEVSIRLPSYDHVYIFPWGITSFSRPEYTSKNTVVFNQDGDILGEGLPIGRTHL